MLEEIPLYYQNFDLHNIQTPVVVDELVKLLRETGYDHEKTKFLEEGFRQGFDIGHRGPETRQSTAANIPLTLGSKTELWNKLMNEVKLKRVAGPFETIPYENFIQSPIGLVPKSNNKTRLIFHLSYEFETGDRKGSLNQHTTRELCMVKYKDLDYAIHTYLKLTGHAEGHYGQANGRQKGKQKVFSGKTDIQSAFRLLPLLKKCCKWLIMKAQDPQTNKWMYFIDKCLPFGASISCALFQKFSDALCYITEIKTNSIGLITNYLDDFLFIALLLMRCNYLIQSFLDICGRIGVPIALEKTEWGSEMTIFLGILLDGRFLRLGIPLDKRDRAIQMLEDIIRKKKATVKELQCLCGYLNFLCRAVFPGQAFVRRMYAKYSIQCPKTWQTARKEDEDLQMQQKTQFKMKPYHHVRLDQEFKLDCKVWLDFLTDKIMKNAVSRPMVDLLAPALTSTVLNFCSDASGNKENGYGCIFNKNWIAGTWEKEFFVKEKPSIEYLELFVLVAGVLTYDTSLKDCRIIVFCDNQAVVHMVNQITSGCKNCMVLIRMLTLNGLKFNRRVSARYISTLDNDLADALSRGQMTRYRRLGPNMNKFPDKIDDRLWPMSKLWIK